MKIAIFTDTFFPDQINGAAHVAYQSVKILEQRGHEVRVFTVSSKRNLKAQERVNDLKITRMPSIPFWGYAQERITIPFGYTLRSVRKFNPDVIHAHMPFALGWEAVLAARILRKPLVGTHHTFFDHYLKHVKLDFGWFKRFSWRFVNRYYNRCDLVLSPSHVMAEGIKKHGLSKPIQVMRNPVETEMFKPVSKAEKAGLKQKFGVYGPLLMYAGRVSYEKSIDQVVLAFAEVLKIIPQAKLMIVGDGPERKNLENLSRELNISDRVIFTGFLLGSELVEAFQAADLFATASKSENMPLTILEAMSSGLPIVGVNALGIPEVVKHEQNGFVVPADNPEKLAEKICEVLQNPALLEQFSLASRELSLVYSYDAIGADIEDIYQKLIQPQEKSLKICVYLDLKNYFERNKIATGIYSSYRNQLAFLEHLNISFVEKWDKNCDILQANSPWPKSLYYMWRARRAGKKTIIWAHATVEDGMAVFRFMPWIAPLARWYYTYAYGSADLVFCPSAYTKSLLAAYGLPEEKLIVQSNAVDLQKFFTSPEKRHSGREKFDLRGLVVGTVGQVQPRKGTDTFLKLCEEFPDHQFLWAGGFLSKLVVKPLPDNLPPNAKFPGFVDDINEAFNALDIFIFPSYEENQGMVVLEAAALGLPILVRDIPVYQGWLKHGENCLKAGSDEEFVVLLKQLLTDSQLREKLGQAARELAHRESIEVLGQKLVQTYQRLISGSTK